MEKLPMTAERCSCRFGPSDEPLGVCAYHQEWAKRISELEAEASFLLARLGELEAGAGMSEETARDFYGHVEPSMSRLRGLLRQPL